MIDEGIEEQWPEAVREALARFQLGHLIERPPLLFARDPAHPLWRHDLSQDPDRAPIVAVPESAGPPYGIITTQTCDLNEQRRYPVQPWFSMSPVYRVGEEANDDRAIRGRQYLHIVGPPSPGLWVADLRLEVPLEKSVLVGREPIEAFSSEDERVAFANRLGRRRDRAALGNVINDVIDRKLRDQINNNPTRARRVFESVLALGLSIEQGDRLEPIAVQVHVITTGGDIPEQSQGAAEEAGGVPETAERLVELKEWFDRWWDKARQRGEQHDPHLQMLANRYHDGTRMDLRVYRDLIPIERRP